MHRRRTAPAFDRPPVIQIGNSVQNLPAAFLSEKYFRFDKKHLFQTRDVPAFLSSLPFAALQKVTLWLILLLLCFGVLPNGLQAGTLQNVKLIPRNDTVGVGTIYLLSFQVQTALPADGKIYIHFPAGFDISEVGVASNVDKLDGGFEIERDLDSGNRIVILIRDGRGSPLLADSTGIVKFSIVRNPRTPGSFVFPLVTTEDGSGNLLDQRNFGIEPVIIKPAPLDHFTFSQIGAQIANQNITPAFTLTAKDEFNNNVTLGDSVFLSDNTGTLTLKGVFIGAAQSSISIGNAKIARGQPGVVINASAKTSKKTGASNPFNVNELKILSIDTAPDKVSRGQKNIEVNMLVQNVGPDVVTLTNTQLNFKRTVGGASENASYTVSPPSSSTISGASVKTLKFSVAVNANASLVSIDIDGSVTGSVAGGTVSDNDADTKDSWTVQAPPAISYVSPPGLTPGNVSAGSSYEFQVSLRNAGEAALELKPDSTTISFGSGGNAFFAKLDANRVTTIPGKTTATLTFRLTQVSASLEQKLYTPVIKLIGIHNTVRFEQTLTQASITVGAPPSLQIQSIASSQDIVTQGMRKPWTIKIAVKNNSTSPVDLISTDIALVKLGTGGGTDTTYQITRPAIFENSRSAQLSVGLIDTLKFQITKTGNQTGILGVFAKVFVSGLDNPAESNGTQKSILAQTPMKLSLALRTSQNNVTEGQTQLWKIFMKVKNSGEAAARVVFDESKPNQTTRTSVLPGFTITPAETDIILAGQDSTDIVFNVEQTGVFGDTPFDGQVFAREFTSDSLHSAAGSSRINVQRQARVRVKSMQLSSLFNPDTVNTGQEFFVQAHVEKTVVSGAEKVDSVKVRLVENPAAGNATILTNDLTLTDLAQPASFKVKAGNSTQVRAAFNANILQAYSANTGASTVRVDGNANFTPPAVYIQRPGTLVIDSLKTSESRVRFGRTSPWFISLYAKNPAGANGVVVVDSTRLSFKSGQAVQNDYTIVNRNPTDSLFFANQQRALRFDVTKTGTTGGTATITATVYFHDRNSFTKRSVSRTTTIFVETTALVTIANTTFPPAINRLAGTEIALVDTGQVFPIIVTVRNTGFEQVQTAWLSLRSTSNKSKILTAKAQTGSIATESGIATAQFTVKAASEANLSGEMFTARVDSAFNSVKAKINVGLALSAKDTTAVARIELPARLQLSLVTADGATAYGYGQQFKIRARIKNLGQAQVDDSGLLKLVLPQGKSYSFANNEIAEKKIAANDSVEWNVVAPNAESLNDAFVVNLTAPLDKNSGTRAQVANGTAQITLSTRTNKLRLEQKSIAMPAGAADRILSTDQIFTIRAQIGASPNLTNKTVTLDLPNGAGFRLVNGEAATKNIPADTARWQVQAPSLENLKPVGLLFTLSAFNASTPVSNLDSLVILRTEKQAILQLDPAIQNASAQNGMVAVNQNFTLVARLRNTGRAQANGDVEVKLSLPAKPSTITVQAPLQKSARFTAGTTVQEIIWQAQAAKQPQQDTLTFSIIKKPLDENTGIEALAASEQVQFVVTTVNTGTVAADRPRITAPPGAQSDHILSTGQEFIISDTLRWTNAANLTAELKLPAGFTIFNRVQNILASKDNDKTEVAWVVRAPAGPIANVDASVRLKANDSHDASVPLEITSVALQFNVVRRAEVSLRAEITDPVSAMDGVLSVNQPFTVTATLSNRGTARVNDAARVFLLLPAGYQFVNLQQDSTLSITAPDSICSWLVRAPSSISQSSDLMTLQLTRPPLDENTGAWAAVKDGEAALAIRTEGRKLIVGTADQGGGPAIQGQKDLLLMRLLLSNPAGSDLKLQMLRFDLQKKDGTPVKPAAVFQKVRIVNEGLDVGATGAIPADSSTLRIALNVGNGVNITPGKPDTVSIFADLTASATGNFRLLFDHGNDFDAIDLEGGVGVAIESGDGKQGDKFRLESNFTALHGATDEESFFNYPNPFPPGKNLINGEGTRFSIPAGLSGELKIVTLLGELVWETKIDSRRADIFWDGNNGAGQRVLNGVYVAILKTNNGKMLSTKVAVLKK